MGPQEARDPSWDVIWAEILTGDLWNIPMDAGSPEAPKVLAGGERLAGPFMRPSTEENAGCFFQNILRISRWNSRALHLSPGR